MSPTTVASVGFFLGYLGFHYLLLYLVDLLFCSYDRFLKFGDSQPNHPLFKFS